MTRIKSVCVQYRQTFFRISPFFFFLSWWIQRDNCISLSQQRKKAPQGSMVILNKQVLRLEGGEGALCESTECLCAGFLPEDKENLRNKSVSVPQRNPRGYSTFWKKPFTSQTVSWVSVSAVGNDATVLKSQPAGLKGRELNGVAF